MNNRIKIDRIIQLITAIEISRANIHDDLDKFSVMGWPVETLRRRDEKAAEQLQTLRRNISNPNQDAVRKVFIERGEYDYLSHLR